jgi:hypothetical protein
MAEDTDLLPWLLGGMLALSAVAAIAVGVPDSTPGGAPTAPNTTALASTAQAVPGTATGAAHSAAPADLSPVVVAANARPQLPPGQVWECEVNGQRVFSDVQCGAHATVRQLSESNVFDATAAYGRSTPRPYGYGYGPGPDYYPPPGSATDAPADEAGAGDPIYTQVIVVHDRARRDQPAHHNNHPHPRAGHP